MTEDVGVTEERRSRPAAPPQKPSAARQARKRRSEFPAALGFLTPSAAGLTIFILFPTVLAFVTSLYIWPTFGEISFGWFVNYTQLFAPGSPFPRALLNTVIFTVIIVPANLVLALGMALWVASSRLKRFYRVFFFLPVVTPTVATSVIWKMLYQQGGPVDYGLSFLGLHLPNILASTATALPAVVVVILWQGLGYNLLIFSAAIDQLPDSVLEAGRVDGATGLRLLLLIKVPLLTPAIFFAVTITMIQAFQIFTEPFVMTAGGPGNATTTVVMNVYQTAFQEGSLGAASAPAMVLFGLILVATLVQWVGQGKWVHYES